MNLFEPWIFLRLVVGLGAALLFLRSAYTAVRVLRRFDVARASEGQLVLEKNLQLTSTLVRVALVLQVVGLALSALAAERMRHEIRGAMCGYGVFAANAYGFPALGLTVATALAAGVAAQVYALDARMRDMSLARPIAVATLVLAGLSLADFVATATFLSKLDLSVVATCCSVELDTRVSTASGYVDGPHALMRIVAPVAMLAAALTSALAARRPRRSTGFFAGAVTFAAFPIAIAFAILETAPHTFEVPQHTCPFCLLKGDALGLGYFLFGALFVAFVWAVGAGVGALLAGDREEWGVFAKQRLRRDAVAWLVALALGIAPVIRYAWVSGGHLLTH